MVLLRIAAYTTFQHLVLTMALQPHPTLLNLHTELLSLLCNHADRHFQGITVAAKHQRRRGLLSPVQSKRIEKVDIAYHIVRHITDASSKQFLKEVTEQLQTQSPATPTTPRTEAEHPQGQVPATSVGHTTVQAVTEQLQGESPATPAGPDTRWTE